MIIRNTLEIIIFCCLAFSTLASLTYSVLHTITVNSLSTHRFSMTNDNIKKVREYITSIGFIGFFAFFFNWFMEKSLLKDAWLKSKETATIVIITFTVAFVVSLILAIFGKNFRKELKSDIIRFGATALVYTAFSFFC